MLAKTHCHLPAYVLVTAARNEEALIAQTIRSVTAQTIRPRKWVIVSDGSTDGTEAIVERFQNRSTFIELVRSRPDHGESFRSKVHAFKAGYERLSGIQYDLIGNLDADLSFPAGYFESILQQFAKDPRLGIAGGDILELVNRRYVTRNSSLSSVAGAVQLFRRQCFEDIGGLFPMERGGEDTVAEIMAQMNGWEVRTFPDYKVLHHRRVLARRSNILSARFNKGVTNYLLGYHPLFQLATCVHRALARPILLGSLFMLAGYSWGLLKMPRRPVPDTFVRFMRSEQIRRLTPWRRRPLVP